MKLPKVSIIFPIYNGGQNPFDCLHSIKSLNYPNLETIVVDNHSTDGSTQGIKKKFPWAKILYQKRNLGFAAAVNIGINNSKGDYLFITNDDIVFKKDSLKTLVDYAQSHPEAGIVGGKQVKENGKFLTGGRNFNLFTGRQSNIDAKKPIECGQIDGCVMLISKAIIGNIGIFDEGFSPIYGEDLDYCLRVKKAGFSVVYHPKAVFIHKYAQTTSKFKLDEIFYLGFKNKLRVIIKQASFLQIIIFLLFNSFIIVPIRIIILRQSIIKPQMKALAWNLKNLPKTLSLREKSLFLPSLLGLAFFGGLIRIISAVFIPLDGDETYQLLISKVDLLSMLKATLSVYPPSWSLVLHFTETISTNYIFIRLIAVFIGTFSILVIGYLGKTLFNPKTGFLTALIFALSPTQIYHSANVRVYSLAILISALSFLLFAKFLKTRSKINNLFLFLAFTIGNYTYYLFPVLSFSFLTFIYFERKKLAQKFKTFTIIFILSLFASLPLFISFLRVEPIPKIILPEVTLQKIILIPISYTFALNLAFIITNDIFKINFIKIILLGLALLNTFLLIPPLFSKMKRDEKFLYLLISEPIVLIFAFSYFFFSVFGLRSLLIFSIPFYLIIALTLTKRGKLAIVYVSLSLIVVLATSISFVRKPPDEVSSFISTNIKEGQTILHTEFTTFDYFSYVMPNYVHKAAIDSVYINQITKDLSGFKPVQIKDLKGKNFWLVEVPFSPFHQKQIAQFKNQLQDTHKVVLIKRFGNLNIYDFEPK